MYKLAYKIYNNFKKYEKRQWNVIGKNEFTED